VTAEGAQSLDGTLTVTPDSGFVSIDGSLGVHGTAAFDGLTTIGGDLVVAGTLSLPNAIIGDDALVNPSMPLLVTFGATNFALNTTDTTVASLTVTVPPGVTRASVFVVSRVGMKNTAASADSFRSYPVIGGFTGTSWWVPLLSPGGYGDVSVVPLAITLTGLTPGATFDLTIKAQTATLTWTANTANLAEMAGSISWLR
jgi:hypothetical protein